MGVVNIRTVYGMPGGGEKKPQLMRNGTWNRRKRTKQ